MTGLTETLARDNMNIYKIAWGK